MSRDTSEAKKTQANAILQYLFNNDSITVEECQRLLHIGDGRARIRDLRDRGWPILDVREEGETVYGKTRYKRYFLPSCRDCKHLERRMDHNYCWKLEMALADNELKACQLWEEA